MMEEFAQAVRNGKAYVWMCNHGHEFTKRELMDIIKEYDFTLRFMLGRVEGTYENMCAEISDSIIENLSY